MNRLTLGQIRVSTLPEAIGLCAADQPRIIAYTNEAIQRLVIAGGETGWYGTWARTAFNVSAEDPFITLPRSIARIVGLNVCSRPIGIQNEWYEFLEFGIGLQPVNSCRQPCQILQMYDRGVVITPVDMTPPNKKLRIYMTDARDATKRVLIQGEDGNDVPITSQDGLVRVDGEYVVLASPFVDTENEINLLTGIQKDVTIGRVLIYELDTLTDTQTLILTMEPSETIAAYRRYFINGLPTSCCGNTESLTLQVEGLAKLEFIPMVVDTDYSLIGNLPALVEEVQSIRYGRMDTPQAHQLSILQHRLAIKLLNQELDHYVGRSKPAIDVAIFGSAKLDHQGIGTLI